ncbi:MAG: LysR family transcriptional regulator [Gammaproteobacteria bacterium]|nr:LysR family transcriptional regulator [Gammaproteobacteria bacterium]
MAALSHLRSLQALEAAIRAGSLKGAAAELSITPAAVGQRIKTLEDYLGEDLLMRGRSGLSPTTSCHAALEHLRRGFRQLEAAAEALELQRGHEIHVAALSDFAELWLKPRLSTYRAMHPNTLFCINGEGDVALRVGPGDCEIFFGPVVDDPCSDVLFRDFVAPVSSPENTRRISRSRKRYSLEGFPLLHLDFYRNDPAVPSWAGWTSMHGRRRTAPERGIRFQRIAPVLDAVMADAGLALCGLVLATALVEQGRLSLTFGARVGVWTEQAFQARYRNAALLRPQVRRFRAWLVEEANMTRAQLVALAGVTPAEALPANGNT